ncbi:Ig-like domain-containing protein [Aphelenchoides bicaudatus]|nr:Ig-like domain-containing protein [Aphelenchoides bicaudatus]
MVAPFFEAPPSIINKPDGSVLFECMLNSNSSSEPTVQWFLKDKELTGDRYVKKIKKQVGKYICTLVMKNPTQADQGVYKVLATNPQGKHSVEQRYAAVCVANEVFKTQQ